MLPIYPCYNEDDLYTLSADGGYMMKKAMSDVGPRLNILQGQLYAACRMGAWCFSSKRELFFTTAPHQEEYHMLLQAGGCLDLAFDQMDAVPEPRAVNGLMGLITEWVRLQNGGRYLVILGPIYLKNISIETSLHRLDRKGISQHVRRQFLNVLGDVPVLEWDQVRQYAAMLHFTIYEENLNLSNLAFEKPEETLAAEREEEETEQRDKNDLQRMVAYEKWMIDNLGKDRIPETEDSHYQGEIQDFHLNDQMRQIKDNLIIFTALCARRAITSGVPLRTAKHLESDWICRIESCHAMAEAAKLLQGMYGDFSRQIKYHSDSSGMSKAVRECRDYVRLNYMKPLSLEEIARHCGYTEYYLTRKFAKETGMKLTDYIRSIRIDTAKAMLVTSNKDIQQISEELQFGSRNYFDRIFRQLVGVSPARFREEMGQVKQGETK